MSKLLLFVFLFLSVNRVSFSQGHPVYNRTIELNPDVQHEAGQAVACDESNICVFAGRAIDRVSPLIDSLVLTKLDPYGNILWLKSLSLGNNMGEYPRQVIVQDNGDILIGGLIQEYDGFDINSFLLKVNSNGDLLWFQEYGFNDSEEDLFKVIETFDGGFLIGGKITENPGYEWDNAWLVKVDSLGNIEWELSFGNDFFNSIMKVFENENGTFKVVVKSTDVPNLIGLINIYTISSLGEILSVSLNPLDEDRYIFNGAMETQDGGIVVLGMKPETPFGVHFNGYIFKLDSLNNFEWDLIIENGMDASESFSDGVQLEGGNIIVSGSTFDNFPQPADNTTRGWLAKIASDGTLLWEKVIKHREENLNEYLRDLVLCEDGGIVSIGTTRRLPTPEMLPVLRQNLWMLKLDTSGNSYAPMVITGLEDQEICTNDSLLLSPFTYNGDLCPYSNGDNCEPNFWWSGDYLSNDLSLSPYFISEETGEFDITYTIVDALGDTANINFNITVLPTLNLPGQDTLLQNESFEIISDFAISLSDFSGSASAYLNEVNGQLYFESNIPGIYELVFHNFCGEEQVMQIVVEEETNVETLPLFAVEVGPNPSKDFVVFQFTGLEKESVLRLYNSIGQKVKTVEIVPFSQEKRIELSDLTSGVYFWKLGLENGKILKQ